MEKYFYYPWTLRWLLLTYRDSEVDLGGRCPKPTPRTKSDGVMLAGVVVASSCQIVLPVFGVLFLIVGTVLTRK